MKRILFTMFIANALIILSLGSCKKETFLPSYITDPIQHYPITTDNLVASRWIKNEQGIYVSILKDVPGVGARNRVVKIYLRANAKETQINDPIPFMSGKLWAASTDRDIEIDYFPENQSFLLTYLVIKVVVE